jgi:hypothetical protein
VPCRRQATSPAGGARPPAKVSRSAFGLCDGGSTAGDVRPLPLSPSSSRIASTYRKRTGFYHDGRFATLLDVVNHYNTSSA